jgi:hypothetical protein
LRMPRGIVGAISPFNFPCNLVAHKLAPALAAGCAVVLKPASATPGHWNSAASRSTRRRPSEPTRCRTAASKASGNTREGPAYGVRELTDERLVVIQL